MLPAQLSELVAPHVALSPAGASLGLVLGLLVAMGPVCRALGGALYNPANNAFLFALGQGSAREHAVRAVSAPGRLLRCYGAQGRGWLVELVVQLAAAAPALPRAQRCWLGLAADRSMQVAQALGGVAGGWITQNLLPAAWTK